MNAKELALQVADTALEKQALSVEIMDVGQKVDYTDYIVICSGRTDRQVDAIASEVEATLKKEGVTALGVASSATSYSAPLLRPRSTMCSTSLCRWLPQRLFSLRVHRSKLG